MKLLLKNPAPTDSRMKKWGDFHFGRQLTQQLQALGIEVQTQYQPEWGQPAEADAVLVLRGRHPYSRDSDQRPHLMWMISHPDDAAEEELTQFDHLFIASERYARQLADGGLPASALLQCTEPDQFFPSDDDQPPRDVVFVGNTRDQRREIVFLAQQHGLRPRVWGRGWDRFSDAPPVVADYFDNENLGQLYGRSRLCLNDHWPDMKARGFVSNRIFDALACGLPVLSDHCQALEELALPGVLTYTDSGSFAEAVEHYLFSYPSLRQQAAKGIERIRRDFSFAARARVLAEWLKENI